MSKLIKISGLWARKDKNDELMLSANINKFSRYVIVKNAFKRDEKDPDYHLCVSEIEKKLDVPVQEELPF